jgi:small subunit ribosomal protein S31
MQELNGASSDIQQEQNVDTSDVQQEQIVEPNDVQEKHAEPSDLQQEQIVDLNDVQQEQNEKMGIKCKQKRRQRKLVKSKQHKKSKIARRVEEFSSSDDNILVMHLQQHKQIDSEVESIYESGDSFKPSKEDYNSSDSNLSSPSDKSANSLDNLDIDKRIRKKKRKKHQVPKDTKRNPVVVKQPTENMNTSKTCTPIAKGRIDSQTVRKSTQPIDNIAIYTAKQISVQEATFNEIVKTRHEKRLDDVLFMNGYERKYVAPDGNCFFQSVLSHISKIVRSSDIHQILCNHIIDYATEYVGFFSVSDMSESFDEDISWIEFRQEIDRLAVNGNWTSRVADLLPLALANWSGKNVRICSSLSHQPILDIKPILCQALSMDPITLA